MRREETLECPMCGSVDVDTWLEAKTYSGSATQVTVTLVFNRCRSCATDGDFSAANDRVIQDACLQADGKPTVMEAAQAAIGEANDKVHGKRAVCVCRSCAPVVCGELEKAVAKAISRAHTYSYVKGLIAGARGSGATKT